MTIYTDVFGGANVYPSEISYSSLSLTANVTLSWPEETSTNVNHVCTVTVDDCALASGEVDTRAGSGSNCKRVRAGGFVVNPILLNSRGHNDITVTGQRSRKLVRYAVQLATAQHVVTCA